MLSPPHHGTIKRSLSDKVSHPYRYSTALVSLSLSLIRMNIQLLYHFIVSPSLSYFGLSIHLVISSTLIYSLSLSLCFIISKIYYSCFFVSVTHRFSVSLSLWFTLYFFVYLISCSSDSLTLCFAVSDSLSFWFTFSQIHCFSDSLSLIVFLIHFLSDSLSLWFTVSLIHCSVHCLSDSLSPCFSGSLSLCFTVSVTQCLWLLPQASLPSLATLSPSPLSRSINPLRYSHISIVIFLNFYWSSTFILSSESFNLLPCLIYIIS